MTRVLAIDWGAKRCGLAWTDPLGLSTNPLPGVAPSALLATLDGLVQTGPVGTLVLGHPRNLDGSPTDATGPVEALYAQLRTLYPTLSVVLLDERLTSRRAQQVLHESGLGRKRRQDKARLDALSAVLLLQTYLAQQG